MQLHTSNFTYAVTFERATSLEGPLGEDHVSIGLDSCQFESCKF